MKKSFPGLCAFFSLGLVVATPLGATGCGSSSSPDARPTAVLGGAYADTPWPSDAFLSNGHIAVTDLGLDGAPASVEALRLALADLDGAPVTTSIFFPTTGGSLSEGPLDAKAHVVDLTDGAAAPLDLSLFYRASTQELVALAPAATVLVAGHRYGCWVDDSVVRPSDALSQALRGQGPLASLYTPLSSVANADHVGAATVFTVGHATTRLHDMVSSLEKSAVPHITVTSVRTGAALEDLFGAPTTTRPGIGDPNGVVHESIGWVVLGTFDSPNFLSRGDGALGLVETDASGAPVQHGTTKVPFMLALPKKTGSLANTPVMIFQHGLNAGRAQVGAIANDYARAGYATIGIDALWHGNRRPSAIDVKHNYSGKDGADGLADNDNFDASIWFFDFNGDKAGGVAPSDARIVRDNFRQAVTDIASLTRVITKGDFAPVAAADPTLASFSLDGSNVVYSGESFGSILGAQALAVTPALHAATLSVGGAGIFLPTFPDSPYFAPLAGLFLRQGFDSTLDVMHPDVLPAAAQRSLSLLQAAIGPGDPASFAPEIASSGKSLLLIQAFSDEIIPNQSGELLAAAAQATEIDVPGKTHALRFASLPNAGAVTVGAPGAPSRAIVNLDPATHTMFTAFRGDRHFVPGSFPAQALSAAETIDNPTELAHSLTVDFAKAMRASPP